MFERSEIKPNGPIYPVDLNGEPMLLINVMFRLHKDIFLNPLVSSIMANQ